MKRLKRFPSLVAALVSLAALTAAPWLGQAQVYPGNFNYPTNLPSVLNAGAVSNTVSWIAIPKSGSLAIQATFNTSTNVGTELVGFRFRPSVDGTNLSTAVSFDLVAAANGVTNVTMTTNFGPSALEGYSYLVLSRMTNGTAGTLTNKGVLINRVFKLASW